MIHMCCLLIITIASNIMSDQFKIKVHFVGNQTLHEQQQEYYRDVIFDVDRNDDRTIESDSEAETSSEGI